MSDTPRRYKTRDELSPDELLAVKQARHRGKAAPKFETDAYREARAEALRDAGFSAEADEAEHGGAPSIEEMSAAEHHERRRR